MRKLSLYSFVLLFLFTSCHTEYKAQQVQFSNYRLTKEYNTSSSIATLIKPYGDSLSGKMDVVIGENETLLERKRQANTLGYFITDAYLAMAKQKISNGVDIAFMNTGGVRLPDIAAGPVTQGKIYELMPFDNLMVSVKMTGRQLKQYLDTLAARDGILESGMTMTLKNNEVSNVKIGNKPLDLQSVYTIVHSDYVVINTPLLKDLERSTNGYLLRDAIIDYVEQLNKQGKKIKVTNIDRISYVN